MAMHFFKNILSADPGIGSLTYIIHCSVVKHILCCEFVFLVFVLLPVSLDCPLLIAPSVFFNVYLHW